jgi:hypothetical protein
MQASQSVPGSALDPAERRWRADDRSVIEAGYRLLHRIVRTNPPTEADFLSAAAQGVPYPDDSARHDVWDGLSMYSTLAQARRKQRASPVLGPFIAVVRIPLDGRVRIEKTFGAGHHTVWSTPSTLLALVVAVEPA